MKLLIILIGLLLAGCATTTPAPGQSAVPTTTRPPAQIEKPIAAPASISVPSINAESTLIPLGLNADRSLAVPDVSEPQQASWYTGAMKPGEVGPAIILGHIDGRGQRGVFYELADTKIGAEIHVKLEDGTTKTFTVYEVDSVDKDNFPADRVFGETEEPEIRLVSCGGAFDRSERSYQNNIIVYGRLSA